MHLLIVSQFPPTITGVGQYGYHITRGLAGTGAFDRITVLAEEPESGEKPNHLGNTEIEYCWRGGRLDAGRAILSRIRQLKPDLIWFNLRISMFGKSTWMNATGLSTPMLTRRMGYPTVVTLHELVELADLRALDAPGGRLAPLGARLITDICTQADVVCLTLRHYVDWIAKTRPGVECMHIPHGAFYDPVRQEEAPDGGLLLFNMLAPFKGIELLLDAYHELKFDHPDLSLTIAGEEHPRFPGYVKQVKGRINGARDIRWAGRIHDEDLVELFRQARIVVLPYTASTGASGVLHHAATWGRPVVASDLNELRQLARENNFHLEYFANGDPASLRAAIDRLLRSPDLRRAQAENNFKSIQALRLGSTCNRYLRAFDRALEKRNSPKRIPLLSATR